MSSCLVFGSILLILLSLVFFEEKVLSADKSNRRSAPIESHYVAQNCEVGFDKKHACLERSRVHLKMSLYTMFIDRGMETGHSYQPAGNHRFLSPKSIMDVSYNDNKYTRSLFESFCDPKEQFEDFSMCTDITVVPYEVGSVEPDRLAIQTLAPLTHHDVMGQGMAYGVSSTYLGWDCYERFLDLFNIKEIHLQEIKKQCPETPPASMVAYHLNLLSSRFGDVRKPGVLNEFIETFSLHDFINTFEENDSGKLSISNVPFVRSCGLRPIQLYTFGSDIFF